MTADQSSYIAGSHDEIRLMRLATVVWRRKGWVVGAALGVAVLAFVLSQWLPNRYTAKTMLIITPPQVLGQLDERIELRTTVPTPADIDSMAESPSMLRHIMEHGKQEGWLSPEVSLSEFSQFCRAQPVPGSTRMMVLTITARSPEPAERLAGFWAKQIVTRSRELFAIPPHELAQLEARSEEARKAMAQAEESAAQTLLQARAQTREIQLLAEQQALTNQLERIDRLRALAQDAQALQHRLGAVSSADHTLSLGEMLHLLALEGASEGQVEGLQLQIDLAAQDGERYSLSEAQQVLKRLIESISAQQKQLRDEIPQIVQDLTRQSEELLKAEYEQSLAEAQRDEAWNLYEMARLQVSQAKLAMAHQSDIVAVAAEAAAPEEPSKPSRLSIALLSGALAAALVSGLIIFTQDDDAFPEA